MRWLVTIALAASAACGGGRSAPPSDSGIEGLVTIGPTCPVVQEGMDCADKPYAADLLIVARPSRELVARVRSGVDGRFRVSLAPGEYTVQPATEGAGPPIGSPVDAAVRAHAYTQVDVSFDSGIR